VTTKAVVTTVSECDETGFKVSSFYDFWGLVHNEGFPDTIEFGKLDSYGLTTNQLLHDIVQRDIDSRFMVIPKGYTMDNVSFKEELGTDAVTLKEFLECYLNFRNAFSNAIKKSKGTIVPATIPMQKLN
jgi:hypothetical protein